MTSETDQQFMDRVDLDLDLNNTADIQRLFALARRGAAVQWKPCRLCGAVQHFMPPPAGEPSDE